MKSSPDPIALRKRILQNFEEAFSVPASEQEEIMNIIIAGGGPTGVVAINLAKKLAIDLRNMRHQKTLVPFLACH
jgi:NADH dehydrogenase FAD-containing subunit